MCGATNTAYCSAGLRFFSKSVSSINLAASDLLLLAGTNDGEVRLSADFQEIDIHLKRKNSLIAQTKTDYTPLRVKISDRADQVIFEKITKRKYEVIRFSN